MKLLRALQRRFKPPEWAVFREVGNGTGANCRRHADLVAMNLWPSRGMEIVGVEMKESRSDWIRERDNPEKAEAVMQYCDRWYLAVSDPKIVLPGELPPTWGLLTLAPGAADRVIEKTVAPKLEAKPLTRTFVAALLRHAADHAPGKVELALVRREGVSEGFKDGVEHGKRQAGADVTALDLLRKQAVEFEAASGIRINEYTGGRELGQLVKLIGEITDGGGSRSSMNALLSECRGIRRNADEIEKAARAMIGVLHPGHEKAQEATPR